MEEKDYIKCVRPHNPKELDIIGMYYSVMRFFLFLVIGIGIIAFITN